MLSAQELIDCDKRYNKGLMDYACSFIVSNGGVLREQDYPNIMEEGTCEMTKVVTIDRYRDVPGTMKGAS
ncbi:hypothetical protein NL676_025347 [Syzygium grande]|nr:hypothetical protein NL676_025347 [Syzygium grande]